MKTAHESREIAKETDGLKRLAAAERFQATEYKQYGGNYNEVSWAGNHGDDYAKFFDHVGHPSDALKYDNIYIHIPKTGGTSVRDTMAGYSVFPDHFFLRDVKEKSGFENFWSYTFMRNPYTRAISVYEHLAAKPTAWQLAYDVFPFPPGPRNAKSFGKFIELITGRWWDILWEPQTTWIYNIDGKIGVDYVGRIETIQKDLNEIATLISQRSNLPVKIGKPSHKNSRRWCYSSYKDYYTDSSVRKKVEKYYEKDIDFLKVSFNDA